jgi:hypothetical protein
MQPANLPLDLYRGDSGRMQVTVLDKAQQPVDLTGVVAKAEIRDRPAGTTIVPLTCVVTLPNIIDVTLSAVDSHKLPAKGVWDLQLTYASGEVQTLLAGQVQVTPDVTDSTPFPAQLPIPPIP